MTTQNIIEKRCLERNHAKAIKNAKEKTQYKRYIVINASIIMRKQTFA